MFEVVRSQDNKNVGFNFITGSLTTETDFPCFSVIEVDEEFMVPVNFKIYTMDLDQSNALKTPVIGYLSDYLEQYQLTDVSPESMYALSERILNDEDTARLYQWNKHRQYGENAPCDETCRRTLYCETSTSEELQFEECVKTIPDIKGSAFFDILMNVLTDPWVTKSAKWCHSLSLLT